MLIGLIFVYTIILETFFFFFFFFFLVSFFFILRLLPLLEYMSRF
jgi:hypothetical protein